MRPGSAPGGSGGAGVPSRGGPVSGAPTYASSGPEGAGTGGGPTASGSGSGNGKTPGTSAGTGTGSTTTPGGGASELPSGPATLVVRTRQTLRADLHCDNLVVEPGALLATAGFAILCSGTVVNEGTIVTGSARTSPTSTSLGGSGAGGSCVNCTTAPGTSTAAAGGNACAGLDCGGAGSVSPEAAPDAVTLRSWYRHGLAPELAGGGGGAAGGALGGAGGAGLCIEGQRVEAGRIVTIGGNASVHGGAAGGGGGGGTILLVVGADGFTAGPLDTAGGTAILPSGRGIQQGGAGRLVVLRYRGTPPLPA